MPFTPAHVAAAFPFRRTRLLWSALIVGTMAPDFEYFLRFTPEGRHGHTMPGILVLTLPLALITLWIFHKFVKAAFVELMPECLQRRLIPYTGEFRFGGPARFLLIIASIMVGVATHLVWDSFTHPNGWSVLHWQTLQERVRLPFIGASTLFKLLQNASTVFGCAFLLIWLVVWYRSVPLNALPPAQSGSAWPARKIGTLVAIVAIAGMGAVWISLTTTTTPRSFMDVLHFMVPVVVAGVALTWWELVLLGIVRLKQKRKQELPPARS